MLGRHLNGFKLLDEPTISSVELLVVNLGDDNARRSVSPKNHAHRSRVIRQQSMLLERQRLENQSRADKRERKEARPADHRDEGKQG